MKTMKLGRALVAVLLVCALLFSWSPVRAEATSGEAAAGIVAAPIPVSAKIVIAGVVIALGVYLGTNPDAFNQIVEGIQAVGEAAGWVVDGMIDVYKSGDLTYVDADLPQLVKDWLWSEGYLVENFPILGDIDPNIDISEPLAKAMTYDKFAIVNTVTESGSVVYIFYGPSGISLGTETSVGTYDGVYRRYYYTYFFGGNYTMYYWSSAEGYGNTRNTRQIVYDDVARGITGSCEIHLDGNTEYITPTVDIVLGDIARSNQDIATGYPAWHGTSMPITPTGTDSVVTGIPISTPSTYDEAINQTQTEAQSGTTSITDSNTGTIVEGFEGTLAETQAKTFVETIAGFFSDVVTNIKAIPAKIGEVIEVVTGCFTDVISSVQAIPGEIGKVFTDALTAVFVPSEDYLTAKVEAIRAEFAFADSIISSGESIKGYLDSIGPEPPVIYINLDDFEGGYDIGGQVAFLDLRWYERYKPTGDAIISAFLWLVFAWRVFIHLPGLISGARGVVGFSVSSANETGLSSSETGLRRFE